MSICHMSIRNRDVSYFYFPYGNLSNENIENPYDFFYYSFIGVKTGDFFRQIIMLIAL